jgi:hypothetical protein
MGARSGRRLSCAGLASIGAHNLSSMLVVCPGQAEAICPGVFSSPMARSLSVEQEELRWGDDGHFTLE